MIIKAKKNKYIIFLIFISMLLLSSCKSENTSIDQATEASAYTYKEEVINELLGIENIPSACINSIGEVIFYDEDKGRIVYAENTGRIIREINKDMDGELCFAVDGNDNLYVLHNYLKKDDKGQVYALATELIVYNSVGNELTDRYAINEKKGNWEEVKDEIIRKIQVNSKGYIFALKYDSTVEVFDLKLQSMNTLGIDKYWDIAIDEDDNLLAVLRKGSGDKQLIKIDAVNFRKVWEAEDSHSEAPQYIYYNIQDKSLYGINYGIVMKYNMESDESVKLLNINEFTKVDDLFGFYVDSNENIFALSDSEGNIELKCYTRYERNNDSAEKIELNICAYWPFDNNSNSDLLNIARKFEKEHPDVKLNFRVYDHLLNMETGHKNYIEKLNSELLAGKGPDILLGYYPALEYSNKGILVDLQGLIKKDENFNIHDYNEVIINSSTYKDGQYIMPLSYTCHFIIGNKELMEKKNINITQWTWKDFSQLLDMVGDGENEKVYAFPQSYFSGRVLFKNILLQDIDYYVDWDKKEARFNTTDFTELLDMFKHIIEKNCYHPQLKASYGSKDRDEFMESILFVPEYTGCYWNFNTMGQKFDSIRIIPIPEGEKTKSRLFMSYNASILEKSKNKDLSWEFIKYLLSEENQFFLSEYQFVLNKKAEEKRIELFFKQQEDDDMKRVTESEMENIIAIKNSLNKNDAFTFSDEFFDFIWIEVESFLKNEKSAEETAKVVQNKVELYLNE